MTDLGELALVNGEGCCLRALKVLTCLFLKQRRKDDFRNFPKPIEVSSPATNFDILRFGALERKWMDIGLWVGLGLGPLPKTNVKMEIELPCVGCERLADVQIYTGFVNFERNLFLPSRR